MIGIGIAADTMAVAGSASVSTARPTRTATTIPTTMILATITIPATTIMGPIIRTAIPTNATRQATTTNTDDTNTIPVATPIRISGLRVLADDVEQSLAHLVGHLEYLGVSFEVIS